MNVAIIDNYDSFTYNLVHYVEGILNKEITVFLNDKVSSEALQPFDKIILSPGPGLPENAGKLKEIIRENAGKKIFLGVCLGHQAIGEVFGATLQNPDKVFHGVATPVKITDASHVIFRNLPSEFLVGRYHSWVVDKETLPSDLKVTAVDEQGYVMAMRHIEKEIHSVQFHPESVLTEYGREIIKNFLEA